MARAFSELRSGMTPERRRRNDERVEQELRLYDLRSALDYTQQDIAGKLGTQQSSVSKIENRTDLLVSTLRKYLEAIGARLVIRAEFEDGEYDLSNIGYIESSEDLEGTGDSVSA